MEGNHFFLVLGPHRSGSSVTTSILKSLGAELGSKLQPASELYNPMGHFENLTVADYNHSLLVRAGTDWKNPRPLSESLYFQVNRTKIEEEIDALLFQLIQNEKVTALKEPRISILLDLWKPALSRQITDLRIVLTMRHPSEVAASLARRDGMNQILGLQLWAQATLNGIRFAREHSNHFLYFDKLISNPIETIDELANFMGIKNNSREVSEFKMNVKTELRHHRSLDGKSSALKITTDMYEHICRYNNATVENFPDELLNQWQERLTETSIEINRNELLEIDKGHHDLLNQQRDALNQQRDVLTLQLGAILDSTIWKATSPLIKFLTILKRKKQKYLKL